METPSNPKTEDYTYKQGQYREVFEENQALINELKKILSR